MNSFTQMWQGLGRGAKFGLIFGSIFILGLMIALGWWAYRPDYQVLFSDLAPRDAAAMTAELDKMKTPYQLTEGGNTILVPKDVVYKTRLKLMGKDVPLHGAVGFEVFNNADFGMTEFVQKVNYLRAIQGELTRTIMALEGIQSARVHLAIPEQGLFKKAITKPKASVTLAMKSGQVLAFDQITGIQRLVAASVPDIVASDVTVLDQHGVALTKAVSTESANALNNIGGEAANSQLDSKRNTEEYLAKKVSQVLDRTFGPGEAIASVDVSLNLDQSRVTTEEILPAKRAADANPAGVVVRERYASREGEAAASAKNSTGNAGSSGATGSSNTTSEFDYQVGRRVEQLSVASGTVKRMTVAVLVRQNLSEMQMMQLKEVVATAVGINAQRGDAVVVYSMDKFVTPSANTSAEKLANSSAAAMPLAEMPSASNPSKVAANQNNLLFWLVGGLVLAVFLLMLVLLFNRQRQAPAATRLDQAGREELLAQIRQLTEMAQQDAMAAGKK